MEGLTIIHVLDVEELMMVYVVGILRVEVVSGRLSFADDEQKTNLL